MPWNSPFQFSAPVMAKCMKIRRTSQILQLANQGVGNGHSENPDPRIVDAVIDSRIGSANKRSQNQQVSNNFKLWFNTDPTVNDIVDRPIGTSASARYTGLLLR